MSSASLVDDYRCKEKSLPLPPSYTNTSGETITADPVVIVHVIKPSQQQDNMGTISPRTRRKGGTLNRFWMVSGLVLVVLIGMFYDSSNVQYETSAGGPLGGGRTIPKPHTTSHHPRYDVNAPPNNQQEDGGSSQAFDFTSLQQPQTMWEDSQDDHPEPKSFKFKTSAAASSTATANSGSGNVFSLFNWRRFEQQVPRKDTFKKKKKTKKQAAQQQLHPIPIIDDNDDRVPKAVAGAVLRAADALLCRESVIDYVINATDRKDECDGLKKAYTKNCGGDDEEEMTAVARRRRRTLEETAAKKKKNPVIQWQRWIHEQIHSIQRHGIWGRLHHEPTVYLMEDEILNEWNEAQYIVERGWDLMNDETTTILEMEEYMGSLSSAAQQRRKLNEADDFARKEQRLEKREERSFKQAAGVGGAGESTVNAAAPPPTPPLPPPPPNKTAIINRERTKLSNLALPTTKHHVSEKMISETLLLSQEDRLMAHVKAATSNVTANAVADAAKSAKAVSDTYEYVASVLNDPGSIEARTCCTSILNVFHENCFVDEDEEISDSRLFIVVAVIAFCGMIKSLIRHFQIRWLPEAAGCILVGVAAGWVLTFWPHNDLSFDGKWFLRIMVPPIIFEAALSIDKRSFNRHVVPIIFYAIIGTLVSTGLTAIFVHEGSKYYHGYCDTIPVIESLAFGALISSIDPIAVLSVLSNMGMTDTDTIYVVIFGESLLNDGVAIVLYQTLVHFLDINMEVDSNAVMAAAIHFLVVAVGSLLVGLGSGICCTVYYWAMHGCQTPLVEVLMFCCWALLPYYVCDGIEWSGIVAVVAAGFVMDIQVVGQYSPPDDPTDADQQISPSRAARRRRERRPIFSIEGHLSKEAKTHIGFVTEIIATMMETAIFAYLGLFLFSSRYHWNNYHTMIAIGACCASRAVMIPSLSTLANWITKVQQVRANCRYQQLPQHEDEAGKQNNPAGVIIDRKMQLVLWFAGLRGAMSFALVEDIPPYDTVTGEGTRLKSELKAMTSACIIFTVFVLGGMTYYMMDSLGMAPSHAKAESGGKSNLEREMEMIGLLSSSMSKKMADDYFVPEEEPEEFEYQNDPMTTSMPNARSPPPASGNMFRQRTQAN